VAQAEIGGRHYCQGLVYYGTAPMKTTIPQPTPPEAKNGFPPGLVEEIREEASSMKEDYAGSQAAAEAKLAPPPVPPPGHQEGKRRPAKAKSAGKKLADDAIRRSKDRGAAKAKGILPLQLWLVGPQRDLIKEVLELLGWRVSSPLQAATMLEHANRWGLQLVAFRRLSSRLKALEEKATAKVQTTEKTDPGDERS
jgi:hypothetical protein